MIATLPMNVRRPVGTPIAGSGQTGNLKKLEHGSTEGTAVSAARSPLLRSLVSYHTFHTFSSKGVDRLSFTARIERPLLLSLILLNDPSKLAYLSPWEWHPCWSHCGRRARLQILPPSLLVISSGMGADWSSTARSFLTRPPTGTSGRAISPGEGLLRPRVARAQKTIRLHPLSAPGARDQHGCHSTPLRARRTVWPFPSPLTSQAATDVRSVPSARLPRWGPTCRPSRGAQLACRTEAGRKDARPFR